MNITSSCSSVKIVAVEPKPRSTTAPSSVRVQADNPTYGMSDSETNYNPPPPPDRGKAKTSRYMEERNTWRPFRTKTSTEFSKAKVTTHTNQNSKAISLLDKTLANIKQEPMSSPEYRISPSPDLPRENVRHSSPSPKPGPSRQRKTRSRTPARRSRSRSPRRRRSRSRSPRRRSRRPRSQSPRRRRKSRITRSKSPSKEKSKIKEKETIKANNVRTTNKDNESNDQSRMKKKLREWIEDVKQFSQEVTKCKPLTTFTTKHKISSTSNAHHIVHTDNIMINHNLNEGHIRNINEEERIKSVKYGNLMFRAENSLTKDITQRYRSYNRIRFYNTTKSETRNPSDDLFCQIVAKFARMNDLYDAIASLKQQLCVELFTSKHCEGKILEEESTREESMVLRRQYAFSIQRANVLNAAILQLLAEYSNHEAAVKKYHQDTCVKTGCQICPTL